MVELLRTIGSTVKFDKKRKKIEILNKKSLKTFAPYNLLKTMRAGVLVLGPLLWQNMELPKFLCLGDVRLDQDQLIFI